MSFGEPRVHLLVPRFLWRRMGPREVSLKVRLIDLFYAPRQESFRTQQGTASWRGLDLLSFDKRLKITHKSTYAKAKTLKLNPVE
jgi:hypothetical protein